jgi:hypothetical protein
VQTSNEDVPLKPVKNLDDMPIGGANKQTNMEMV